MGYRDAATEASHRAVPGTGEYSATDTVTPRDETYQIDASTSSAYWPGMPAII